MQPPRPQPINALRVIQWMNMTPWQRTVARIRMFVDSLCWWRPAPPEPLYLGFDEAPLDE